MPPVDVVLTPGTRYQVYQKNPWTSGRDWIWEKMHQLQGTRCTSCMHRQQQIWSAQGRNLSTICRASSADPWCLLSPWYPWRLLSSLDHLHQESPPVLGETEQSSSHQHHEVLPRCKHNRTCCTCPMTEGSGIRAFQPQAIMYVWYKKSEEANLMWWQKAENALEHKANQNSWIAIVAILNFELKQEHYSAPTTCKLWTVKKCHKYWTMFECHSTFSRGKLQFRQSNKKADT